MKDRPDITKLPGKYRHYIENLEARVSALEKLFDEQTETRVTIEAHSPRDTKRRYLPETSYRFRLDHPTYKDGAWIEVGMTEPWSSRPSFTPTALEIRSGLAGSLRIAPLSSNLVYVELKQD